MCVYIYIFIVEKYSKGHVVRLRTKKSTGSRNSAAPCSGWMSIPQTNIYIYIYKHIYMFIYTHTYVCMYVCMYVCIYVCMYVCTYVCMYV